MLYSNSPRHDRRGITVLTLLLLIIALIVGAILLVRYVRSRPQVSVLLPHQPLDQLNLPGVI
jgi:hypothetical protein